MTSFGDLDLYQMEQQLEKIVLKRAIIVDDIWNNLTDLEEKLEDIIRTRTDEK
jgi:hypothetical protein